MAKRRIPFGMRTPEGRRAAEPVLEGCLVCLALYEEERIRERENWVMQR